MSILIKGMEMPKSCSECRFAVDGWCYAYGKPNVDALSDKGRTNWCPLIPVPPHGRLIDADAEVGVNVTMMPGGKCRVDLIAPTIIEAEKGE